MTFDFAVVPQAGGTRMFESDTTSDSVTAPLRSQTSTWKLYTGSNGVHIRWGATARSDGEDTLSSGEADHFIAANAVETIHAPAGETVLHHTTASGTSDCKLVPIIAVGPNASTSAT